MEFREFEKFSVGGYLPTSFLDWEGHVAATIFTTACNFRCPWCHNSALVNCTADEIPLDGIVREIARKRKFLDGVVISGGEPTIWCGLFPLLRALKKMRIPVKLDTNGSSPAILKKILDEELVDFVAMDVKAPLNPASLKAVTGVDADAAAIKKSVALIREKAPAYEFRTTWSPHFLTKDDLLAIQNDLGCDTHWVVQLFRPVGCLDEEFLKLPEAKEEELREIMPHVKIRG